VLSSSSDPFYADQLFSNFGDLGAALSSYVQSYQSKTQAITNPQSIETLADMRRFVEEYPEFKKLGGNVSKHVALVGELSKITERDDLLAISEVEQSLASNESHAADLKVSKLYSREMCAAEAKQELWYRASWSYYLHPKRLTAISCGWLSFMR
jgi:vacuolar protein sorting-associated protein 45